MKLLRARLLGLVLGWVWVLCWSGALHPAYLALRALDTGAQALWSANRPVLLLARGEGQVEVSVRALGKRASVRVFARSTSRKRTPPCVLAARPVRACSLHLTRG